MSISGFRTCAWTLAVACVFAHTALGAERRIPLDGIDLAEMTCGRGLRPSCGRSLLGNPLRMAGQAYAHGVGTHVDSALAFEADGRVVSFDAVVGIDDEADDVKGYGQPNAGCVVFRIYADGRLVAESPRLHRRQKPVPIHADLRGARRIVLEAVDGAEWASYWFGHADWADATFTAADDVILRTVPLTSQLGLLTPPVAKAPRINGPRVLGVRPGRPIRYRVPVVGEAGTAVTATSLPAGLSFDPQSRMLTGSLDRRGNYGLVLRAENRYGTDERPFELRVGGQLCLTPMLGWNSWNLHHDKVTADDIRAAADAFVRLGLVDHGWSYVNIDDGWQVRPDGDPTGARTRDANGRILPSAKFPDMKALCEFVHGKGLRIGIYSSPGPTTCGRYEGSFAHEEQDAATWAEWGFDLVKYDLCSYQQNIREGLAAGGDEVALNRRPYELMGGILGRQKRDIAYCLCQYGHAGVENWAFAVGGNSWRASSDLRDSWSTIVANVTRRGEAWRTSSPGCWLDLDMMVLGRMTTFGYSHQTLLTPNEQYAHMGLWALLGSPILLGCDLTALDDLTLNLLTNDGILDIHQDSLGATARLMSADQGATQLWVKPLADGDLAVGVLNLRPFPRKTVLDFPSLGIKGPRFVRDVWRDRCLGEHAGSLELDLLGHEMPVLRIKGGSPCAKCP